MTTESGAYVTDEDGNVVFSESGDGDRCPVCHHTADQHNWSGCTAEQGYDHLNGFEECTCPLAPQSGDS